MSHFVVVVQLSKESVNNGEVPEKYKGGLERALDKALAPFDENMAVTPYEVDCYCKKHKASMLADQKTDEKFGSIADLRDMFAKLKTTTRSRAAQARLHARATKAEKAGDEKKRNKAYEMMFKIDEKRNAEWAKFIHLEERQAFDEKATAEAMLVVKPDADCGECKGTGRHMTTYNPESQWDWYTIGGRWSGYFGEEAGDAVLGKFAKEFLADADKRPYAILTKDGTWHEKGQMGAFGMSHHEKKDSAWLKETSAIIEGFADDDVIVAVDCHI